MSYMPGYNFHKPRCSAVVVAMGRVLDPHWRHSDRCLGLRLLSVHNVRRGASLSQVKTPGISPDFTRERLSLRVPLHVSSGNPGYDQGPARVSGNCLRTFSARVKFARLEYANRTE